MVINSMGYVEVSIPGHPRATCNGRVREHILIAEKALGHHLPLSAQVHHVNKNRSDNRNNNLVICENDAYHKVLHQRMRAVACGHPASWVKCMYCKKYDSVENLYSCLTGRGQNRSYHRSCYNTCKQVRRPSRAKSMLITGRL